MASAAACWRAAAVTRGMPLAQRNGGFLYLYSSPPSPYGDLPVSVTHACAPHHLRRARALPAGSYFARHRACPHLRARNNGTPLAAARTAGNVNARHGAARITANTAWTNIALAPCAATAAMRAAHLWLRQRCALTYSFCALRAHAFANGCAKTGGMITRSSGVHTYAPAAPRIAARALCRIPGRRAYRGRNVLFA